MFIFEQSVQLFWEIGNPQSLRKIESQIRVVTDNPLSQNISAEQHMLLACETVDE